MGTHTEPITSAAAGTTSVCVRCGRKTALQPWCESCSAVLAGGEIELGGGREADIDRVCSLLLTLYEERQPELIPQLFETGAVIRYPRAGIAVGGVEAITTWFAAAFTLAPTFALDHIYVDNGTVWTRFTVSFGATSPSHRPTGSHTARLTLRQAQIATMDIYPLAEQSGATTRAQADSGHARRRRPRWPLRKVLLASGLVLVIASFMTTFLPATDASTGANVTAGFTALSTVALAMGVLFMVLGARMPSVPHRRKADQEGPGDQGPSWPPGVREMGAHPRTNWNRSPSKLP